MVFVGFEFLGVRSAMEIAAGQYIYVCSRGFEIGTSPSSSGSKFYHLASINGQIFVMTVQIYVCHVPLQDHPIQNYIWVVWGCLNTPQSAFLYQVHGLPCRTCCDHLYTMFIPYSRHTLPERLRPFRHHLYSNYFWTAYNHFNIMLCIFAVLWLYGDIGNIHHLIVPSVVSSIYFIFWFPDLDLDRVACSATFGNLEWFEVVPPMTPRDTAWWYDLHHAGLEWIVPKLIILFL